MCVRSQTDGAYNNYALLIRRLYIALLAQFWKCCMLHDQITFLQNQNLKKKTVRKHFSSSKTNDSFLFHEALLDATLSE